MLQKSVKGMFRDYFSIESVREFMDNPVILEKTKTLLSQQGLLGILEPKDDRVTGTTYALLIAQEAGRALLPYPLVENMTGLYALKMDKRHDDLIAQVEEGNKLLTISWRNPNVKGKKSHNGYVLSGTLCEVPFAADADAIIACVRISGTGFTPKEEETVIAIERDHPAVKLIKRNSMDETYPIYEVVLSQYPLKESDIVRSIDLGSGHKLMEKVKQLGAFLFSAEMVGLSERALYDTVEYTKQRKQFDTVIAKFQALKHMAADMYLQVESMKVAVEYAAWALEAGESNADLSVSIAKSYASSASKKVTGDAIQMQGGIGFTWENNIHLFFKRATRSAAFLGDAYTQNEKIAQEVLDKELVGE
jgi:alkylation response protein AidB-like acyl-CoA dehydrogenase